MSSVKVILHNFYDLLCDLFQLVLEYAVLHLLIFLTGLLIYISKIFSAS